MNRVFRKKNDNFVIICNTILRDERISLKAKGVMALVMSLPDNWDFTIKGIVSVVKEGRDSVYAAIKELRQFGYCKIITCRDDRGKLCGNDYVFYDEPQDTCEQQETPHTGLPYTENPDTAKPYTENPTQINKECNKEKNIDNNITPIPPSASFDDFWEAYGYKKSRHAAEKAWNKLSSKDKEAAVEAIPAYKRDCEVCLRSIKYPATYLNQRTWEDEFNQLFNNATTTTHQQPRQGNGDHPSNDELLRQTAAYLAGRLSESGDSQEEVWTEERPPF